MTISALIVSVTSFDSLEAAMAFFVTLLRLPKEIVDCAPFVTGPPDVLALRVAGIFADLYEFC